jgi:signal transduction histidine kinase
MVHRTDCLKASDHQVAPVRTELHAPTHRGETVELFGATARLASGVAHEINNPLQGIKAQLRLISDDEALTPAGRKRLDLISQEVNRIATIVQRLLKLHQTPSATGAQSCLADVMEDLKPFLKAHLEHRKVALSIDVEPPDMRVPMRPADLRQVLIDLTMNALDAMPDGGRLRIEGSRVNGDVVMRVRDNGLGIQPEDLHNVMMPFFTTKGPRAAGLGLPVTCSTVRAFGGRLELTSSPGTGTTISLLFPVSP